MKVEMEIIVGTIGSILSILSTLPQIYKSRLKNTTADISILMYITHIISSACWCIYGFLIGGTLLSIEAGIVGTLQMIMVAFILRDKYYTA